MTQLIADLARTSPNQRGMVATPVALQQALVGRVAETLWILLASVGLVLLVACANVANLFLVRSEARQREVAVRQALGASRRAIARYFLAESALLSIAGGAARARARLGRRAARARASVRPTSPGSTKSAWTASFSAFTFALSLLTALAFGAIPMLRVAPLPASLHETGRGNTASRGRHRARHAADGRARSRWRWSSSSHPGLMLRSFQKLRRVDPGFDAASALTFRVGLPEQAIPDAPRGRHGSPGDAGSPRDSSPASRRSSASTCLLLGGTCFGNGVIPERNLEDGMPRPFFWWRGVSGGYIETAGIRVLRGRTHRARRCRARRRRSSS